MRKKKDGTDEERVLTAEGWLRRIRYTIAKESAQPKQTPVKKAGRPRGRPKKK